MCDIFLTCDFRWLKSILIKYIVYRENTFVVLKAMSLIFLSASRNLCRQRLINTSVRFLSSNSINNDLVQAEKQKQSPKQSPRVRRYHYYLLSIATGALIGTIYALRQVRKHEGVLPEYVANPALLERKAMESRPLPPPATKRVTFNAPPRQHFPFNITLYQYVTWFVFSNLRFRF